MGGCIGIDTESWGIGGSGRIWHAGVGSDYTRGLVRGDEITLILDTDEKSLGFKLNDEPFEVAFSEPKLGE